MLLCHQYNASIFSSTNEHEFLEKSKITTLMKHETYSRDLEIVFIILIDQICKINTCVYSTTSPLLESCYSDERQVLLFWYDYNSFQTHYLVIPISRCIIPTGEVDKFNYLTQVEVKQVCSSLSLERFTQSYYADCLMTNEKMINLIDVAWFDAKLS